MLLLVTTLLLFKKYLRPYQLFVEVVFANISWSFGRSIRGHNGDGTRYVEIMRPEDTHVFSCPTYSCSALSRRIVKSVGANNTATPPKRQSYTAFSWVLWQALWMLVLFQVVEGIYDLKSPPELVQAMFACFEAICPCLLEAQLGG